MIRLNLINKRKELGKTQKELAESIGIARSFYTNIERGVKDPSLEIAVKIAKELKTTIDYIFFNNDVPNGNNDLI
jgi:putative transcriptional regulator